MMAAMAAALAHVIIAESYGHLSWQSLSGTIIAFVAVWAFFDWAIGSWVYKRERARQLKEAQRYSIAGCWGAVLTPQAEKEPVGVSVLNIHSDSNRLSVTGQSFDLKRDKDGKVTLTLGGDWHSTKAAFSGNSLLYEYASFKEQVSGMCIYTFAWKDPTLPPRGYNGAFYDLGGEGKTVRGRRQGDPINLLDHEEAKRAAQRAFEALKAE
jgi:hypothetical protein